jgi:hypothetical protein
LRDTYQYLAGLESMEQQEYSSLCACVYGAVIRASPAMLRTLAGRAGVRAVDVVPADRDPDLSVFSPPVPDQSGVATLPPG